MNSLPISPKFYPLISAGKKTTTIRRGRRNYLVGAATMHAGRLTIPIVITMSQHIRLHSLTTEDAKNDGFNTLVELKRELGHFYPNLAEDEWMTIVRFRLNA
jgi:hypothetical protein